MESHRSVLTHARALFATEDGAEEYNSCCYRESNQRPCAHRGAGPAEIYGPVLGNIKSYRGTKYRCKTTVSDLNRDAGHITIYRDRVQTRTARMLTDHYRVNGFLTRDDLIYRYLVNFNVLL